jgi:hypothetical protein
MRGELTGGLPLSRDYMMVERPAGPAFRESVPMWIFDDRGEIGRAEGPLVDVEVRATVTIAAPPWVLTAYIKK